MLGVLLLVWVPVTNACTGAAQRDLQVARTVSAALVAAGAPGAADAAAVTGQAARRCGAAAFARGVASITRSHGVGIAGDRRTWRRYRFVSLTRGGTQVWRIDVPAMMTAALHAKRVNRDIGRLQVLLAFGGRVQTWSVNPAHRELDVASQARIARLLAGAGGAHRSQALRALRVMSSAAAGQQMDALALLDSLAVANDSARAVRAARVPQRVVRSMMSRVVRRVVSSNAGGWSRLESVWATASQQRLLAARTRQLSRVWIAPRLAGAAHSFSTQLTTPPRVTFQQLPGDPFYPWPQDGSLDSSSMTVRVDKPVVARLQIFSTSGAAVRTTTVTVNPYVWTGVWNGVNDAGTIAPPGAYRYTLTLTDLVANRSIVPGLNSFVIARDTAPPTIQVARIRILGGTTRRRVRVRWVVKEPISPLVTVEAVLRRGAKTRRLAMSGHALAGTRTVARRLGRGAWTASIRVTDGSGNTSTRSAGTVTIR